MSVRTAIDRFTFRGALSPPAVASRQGIWCQKITAAAGSPTVASVSGGSMDLAMDNTFEVQNLCLYMGDILPYDIDDLIRVEFLAKVSASLDATVTAILGVASARNDDPDLIADAALFKLAGSNTLVVETDDGTNEVNDGSADGFTLSTTYKRLAIDFATGIKSQSAPSLSTGGKSDIRFLASNTNGSLRRVGKNTSHSMAAYSGNLQLIAQIQKTSGTATGTLSLLEALVEYKLPA